MIVRLSELLRHTLEGAQEPEIMLEHELALLQRYLEIMEIRFRGRLQVEMHVDSAVRDALVPNLILQPLAENAITHGVSKIDGTGRIEIHATRDGDRLVLSVHDNGPGLVNEVGAGRGRGSAQHASTVAGTLRTALQRDAARARRRWRQRRDRTSLPHGSDGYGPTHRGARRRIRPVSARKPLRILIVDDEALARQRLLDLLAHEPEIDVVGQIDNGEAAVAAIRTLKPDLVFLDVQMPGKTGVEVARAIGLEHMPITIFVTAYDHYALKAFDVAAVDYLVKPFDDERFEQAFRRARRMVELQEVSRLSEHLLALLQGAQRDGAAAAAPGPLGYLERIPVDHAGRCASLRSSRSTTSARAGLTPSCTSVTRPT